MITAVMIICNWYNVVFHQCTHSCQRLLRLLSRLLNMNNILEQVNIKSLIVDDISLASLVVGWRAARRSTLINIQFYCPPNFLTQEVHIVLKLIVAFFRDNQCINLFPTANQQMFCTHLLCVIPHKEPLRIVVLLVCVCSKPRHYWGWYHL